LNYKFNVDLYCGGGCDLVNRSFKEDEEMSVVDPLRFLAARGGRAYLPAFNKATSLEDGLAAFDEKLIQVGWPVAGPAPVVMLTDTGRARINRARRPARRQ
jgi:hypothetical protein